MTASQPFTTTLIASNMKMFKYCWVWEKNRGSNFGCVKFQPMKEHEDVVVFGCGRTTYNPIMQERKGSGADRVQYKVIARTKTENYADSLHGEVELNCGELRYPSSIQKFNTATGIEKIKHPTQKPVALMEYLIKTYTNEGETVLDFTCGSGTTCVACVNLKRKYIGIEQNEKYVEIARKRVQEAKDSMGLFK
jgi:site-specific DNA-methyltransferase (adenine-specific)